MTGLPNNAPTYHKAVRAEFGEDGEVLIYDSKGTLINVYTNYDLAELALQHHNRFTWDKVSP